MIPFDFQDTAGKSGGSELIDRILRRLRETFGSPKEVVTNERLVRATLNGSAPTQVFHGLKGPPRTWEIVGIDFPEMVYEPAIPNDQRDRFVYLRATGAVNVTVRFT